VLNTQQSPQPLLDQRGSILYFGGSYRGFFINYFPRNFTFNKFKGVFDAIWSIYSNRGFLGFFSGIQARVLYQMPATALSWSAYELFKYLLGERQTTCVDIYSKNGLLSSNSC